MSRAMEKSETPFQSWRRHGSPDRGTDEPHGPDVAGKPGAAWGRILDESVANPVSGAGVRAYVDRGRQRLLESHRAGASGAEVVRAHGAMIDCLLRRLFETTEGDDGAASKGRCAVAAQGGYGRGELNPYSDIDVLFLYGWRAGACVESLAEKILYPLWDAGLTVGHAARTVAECARRARRDHVIQTALVDARYVCGDVRLYRDLERTVRRQLGGGAGDRFAETKVGEHDRRRERHGESVFLLEPDVKEGQGGLRDIHAAMWVARVKRGAVELHDLRRTGLLDPGDAETLARARDFLWRTRNELHFLAGRRQDRLTFESQEQAARGLGFDERERSSEVEAFMRSYYLHAEEVNRLSSLVIHRAVDHGPSQRGKPRPGRELRPGVRVAGRTLAVAPGNRGPDELLDLFVDLQRRRLSLGQDSREVVRTRGEALGSELAGSAGANRRFLDVLRGDGWIYETLQELHRTGVLDALVPEFARVRCMALHDLYHIYTVDQHLMRAVKEFERLRSGEFEDSLPRLSQLAREVRKPEILILGILFHDIGKGQGGGHSESGRALALEAAVRMGLDVDEQETLAFLVLHHLLLTGTAFRRDIEDEKTVRDLADVVGAAENLEALYLLTCSDMKAVGPEVWNDWKGALLEDLFDRTLQVLEEREKGEFARPDRDLKVRRIQDRLVERLGADHPAEEVRREFIDAMPGRYFLNTPEESMPLHYRLLRRLGDEPFLAAVLHHPGHGHSEVAICAHDRPGLFASIAGVFAAMGLNVLSARIHTRRDGRIIDVFRISHQGKAEVVMDPGKWSRMEQTLERVLRGRVDVAELVGRARLSPSEGPRGKRPTLVRWDNRASDDFTVVEVYTRDRAGVLFTITYRLSQLDFSIHLAKISTDVDRVADVFYVTDGDGGKVRDRARLEALREALHRELDPDHAGRTHATG